MISGGFSVPHEIVSSGLRLRNIEKERIGKGRVYISKVCAEKMFKLMIFKNKINLVYNFYAVFTFVWASKS